MNKKLKAGVVLPSSYAKSKANFPVLYLLNGGNGKFSDWLGKTTDKMLLQNLADQYNLIIVTPEGETFSMYMDSPFAKDNMFETYIVKEVIEKIDNTYRTIRDRKGRVITGGSMGGHGALYLAGRHPDLYCAAGSMAGAVDLETDHWKIPANVAKQMAPGFERLLGPKGATPDLYAANSVINMADTFKTNGMPLVIDVGIDDFLLEPNRELHRRLVNNQTPHAYSERPGAHSLAYFEKFLPYQILFFSKVLRENGSLVTP